VPELVQAL